MKSVFMGLAVGASLVLATSAQGYDRITGAQFASRSEVIAPNVMAATSQPLATQIALDIMRRGGNAIDAAIAANAALGLMEPTGNGIGGADQIGQEFGEVGAAAEFKTNRVQVIGAKYAENPFEGHVCGDSHDHEHHEGFQIACAKANQGFAAAARSQYHACAEQQAANNT